MLKIPAQKEEKIKREIKKNNGLEGKKEDEN